MEFKHVENLESQEKNEMLEKVKAKIMNLVSDKKIAANFCQSIDDAISAYDDSKEAAKMLAECFETYVRYEPTEKNILRFIRSIDPNVVSREEARHAFFEWDRSDDDCPDECLGNCDEYSSEECEKRFSDRYIIDRVSFNKGFPERISKMRLYALLQEDKITDQERLAMELAPNTGPDPFKKIIYTPLGGQPGYKMKRKYK